MAKSKEKSKIEKRLDRISNFQVIGVFFGVLASGLVEHSFRTADELWFSGYNGPGKVAYMFVTGVLCGLVAFYFLRKERREAIRKEVRSETQLARISRHIEKSASFDM